MANQKALMVVAGSGAVLFALLLSRRASAAPKVTPEIVKDLIDAKSIKVGKYFNLAEFLVSGAFPELASYRPTETELANLRAVCALILDPLREKYGPLEITSGGRPESIAAAHGTTWYAKLKEAGDTPAKVSDHTDFSGVDFVVPGITADKLISLTDDLKNGDNVRQVGLYFKTVKGVKILDHVHTAVITPKHPKITTSSFYYVYVDNKIV